MPFWLAVLAQQLLVVLIPVLGLLYPVLRFAPQVYDWVVQRRVFALYGELKLLEDELAARAAQDDITDLVARLGELEERASRFRPPLYTLRLHLSLVRQRLTTR